MKAPRMNIEVAPGKALLHHLEGPLHHLNHVGVRGVLMQELLNLVPGVLGRFWVKLDRVQLLHVGSSSWDLLLTFAFKRHLGSVMLPTPGRIGTKRNVGMILHKPEDQMILINWVNHDHSKHSTCWGCWWLISRLVSDKLRQIPTLN